MITLRRFGRIEGALRAKGYGPIIEWSETIAPAPDANEFARRAIYVICNSGMKNSVAIGIYERCIGALRAEGSCAAAFGHPGKRAAIDHIWTNREVFFEGYRTSADPIEFLQTLPWVGGITAYHLAKNLGVDVPKPDIHLERLAQRDGTTTFKLCRRLARESGYRIATIDTILWRACADGLLDSRAYLARGWRAAFRPKRFLKQD